MEQITDVLFRAEKEYKNSREKFYLLLREILSNSIQAVLIRKDKDKSIERIYVPEISLTITLHAAQCTISLRDNGEGFTKVNRQGFEELDWRNPEKVKYNFHPLGQGRLALVYFADSAFYETVFQDEDGLFKRMSFPYPNSESGLFSLEHFTIDASSEEDTFTELTVTISKQNTLGRAKTFFSNYPDVSSVKQWFIETFFPVLVTNEDLTVNIDFNGSTACVSKKSIEAEIDSLSFELAPIGDQSFNFKLWLIPNTEGLQGETPISCFARNLKAELVGGKLSYAIDCETGYKFYLTSDYFDETVDNKGERIELSTVTISKINEKITGLLDTKFKQVIENNQIATQENYKRFKRQFPSLDVFVEKESFSGSKVIVNEETLVKNAIESKGKIEKKFWTRMNSPEVNSAEKPFDETDEGQKLLNSSLHIYVKHRERVLDRLQELIKTLDEEGNAKPEPENDIQELLFRRGTTLNDCENVNHLHNLWILDDKFTTFSKTLNGKSTKPGRSQSDIYIWADDLQELKQLLILELKSTTKAHNAGSAKEGMISQVKRYAKEFYKNPRKTLNWDVDPLRVQYLGIILASKSDIRKELTSSNTSGNYDPIPFLNDSYYKDDKFAKGDDPKDTLPIRIELYSYEDIHKLASSRNRVFFRLLNREYELASPNDNNEVES